MHSKPSVSSKLTLTEICWTVDREARSGKLRIALAFITKLQRKDDIGGTEVILQRHYTST